MKRMTMIFVLMAVLAGSCDPCEPEVGNGNEETGETPVNLQSVARLLSGIQLGAGQLAEVYDAVRSSESNGYDEEYMMRDLFSRPGAGVGDSDETVKSSSGTYELPLRDLIREALEKRAATKSVPSDPSDTLSVQDYLDILGNSDMQIYWPYSENWDGWSLPVITFNPEDGSEVNIGYEMTPGGHVNEVAVNERTAMERPVWVINRNDDSQFKSLEMRRREDPDWGRTPGGEVIINTRSPQAVSFKTLILKNFKMKRQYDCWFAGASEFFVKIGAIESFTASTEAELKLYSPSVTDFMIVVKRGQVGVTIPFNAVLVSEWTEQLTQCAFMIIEDDGGTRTSWKCSAVVKYNSKAYGFELEIPYRASDDVVWRGALTYKYLTGTSNLVGHFGDVDLTFEVVDH